MTCTLQGLPVALALAAASADERDVLAGMVTVGPDLSARGPARALAGDKTYYGAGFEANLASAGITLLQPAREGEPPRAAAAQRFKPSRQIIESVTPPSIDHLARISLRGRPWRVPQSQVGESREGSICVTWARHVLVTNG
jgi:hypothetical protein